MSNGLSVDYTHTWESMYKGIDSNGPYYRVSYYVHDWALSDTVANELRGYTWRVGNVTNRIPPHQHPLSTNLMCTDVTIEGVGNATINANGFPSYDNGFLAHVEYRSIIYTPGGSTDPGNQNQIDPTTPVLWCTQELDFASEEYVHEKVKWVWETSDSLNGKPTDIPIRVSLGVTTMSLTFHQLPYLPMGVIRQKRNKLNNATFLGVDPFKLLFLGGKTTRQMNTDGTISQQVTLIFKERDEDWRKFLRKDIIQWDLVEDGLGTHVFGATDFTPLIQL